LPGEKPAEVAEEWSGFEYALDLSRREYEEADLGSLSAAGEHSKVAFMYGFLEWDLCECRVENLGLRCIKLGYIHITRTTSTEGGSCGIGFLTNRRKPGRLNDWKLSRCILSCISKKEDFGNGSYGKT
jgi:hypothetical protein